MKVRPLKLLCQEIKEGRGKGKDDGTDDGGEETVDGEARGDVGGGPQKEDVENEGKNPQGHKGDGQGNNLEDGFDPAPDDVYDDSEGNPHEVIRVGVDAQSVYDADPLDSTRALQKNGMGIGRIKWTGVAMEAKQTVYFAVRETGEIDPKNDAHLSWLRDHVKPTSNRLSFHGQAPRAIALYNERARSGSLPNLRVMLSRGPRRPETMPRRRNTTPRDMSGSGIGDGVSGFDKVTRRDFNG